MLKLTGNSIKQIIKNVFKQINTPYKVFILNAEQNSESFSLLLTKKSLYILLSSILVSIFLLISLLFLCTPIRYYLPSNNNNITRNELLHLRKLSDSLIIINQQREAYIYNLLQITNGSIASISDSSSLSAQAIEQAKRNNEGYIDKASDFNAIRFRKPDSAQLQKMKEIDSLRKTSK